MIPRKPLTSKQRIRMTVRAQYGAAPDITDADARRLYVRETLWRALERHGQPRSKKADRAISFMVSLIEDGADPHTLAFVVRDVVRIASGVRPLPKKKPHLVWRNGAMFAVAGRMSKQEAA
jgi:hypothetical protein